MATPTPTSNPTPHPTATPKPVHGGVHKPKPPCPGKGDGPPGHHKSPGPPDRPCGHKGGNGYGNDKGGGGGNGMVVVLPLALGGALASLRTWLMLGSRRLTAVARTKTGRRRNGRAAARR